MAVQLWLLNISARRYDADNNRTCFESQSDLIAAQSEAQAKDTAWHIAGQAWPSESGWTHYKRHVQPLPEAVEVDGQVFELKVVPCERKKAA